jgi:signal peptidase I
MMAWPACLWLLASVVWLCTLCTFADGQESTGPWQDCDQPITHLIVDSDALLPGIPQGRRFLATCFTHAIRGSSLVAGQIRFESLVPPLARGDLVAFRRPDDTSKTAIRRVIGLPGERVQLRDYRLLINDTLLPTEHLGDEQIGGADGRQIPVVRLHETMRRAILGYDILIPRDSTDGSGTSEAIQVPLRSIFVLDDNRAAAADIRALSVNLVPVANLIARVDVPQAK